MPAELRALSVSSLAALVLVSFTVVTALSSAMGFAAERALPKKKIFDVALFEGQLRFELLGNAIFLAIATVSFTAALHGDVIRFVTGDHLRDALTFAAMFVGFQVYYWFLHRALHEKSLVRFHRWHHRSQVTTPLTGQSMHPVEALGWMVAYLGLPWLFSLVAPVGFWGWVAYVGYNVMGNMVGHANVEPTAAIAATRPATLFANAFIFHALHHARWTGHYSFGAAGMDRLMGTEWSDWHALYERVAAGQALTSMKDRG